MPCNGSHMNPHHWEIELSRVACLLDQLDGKPINRSHWDGYHPRVYSTRFAIDGNKMVSTLCSKLQTIDVTKQSLEMQLWWRNHQAADKQKAQSLIDTAKTQADRSRAIAKLTEYERNLLGIKA